MKKRIITGVLGAVVFLFLILYGGDWLAVAVALIMAVGIREYHLLAAAAGVKTSFPLILILSLLYLGGQWCSLHFARFPRAGMTGLIFLLSILGSFLTALKNNQKQDFLVFTAANLFGLVYPGVFLTYAVLMRAFSPPLGVKALILTLLTVWVTDTSAYFIGSWRGRKKLAPVISPGKTVEGAVGGITLGTAGGLLFGLLTGFPLAWLLVVCPLVSILGQTGDLFESLLKRSAGLKDSGVVFPGHGGVLDRFDSPLFALPVVYYLLSFL